MVHTLSISCIQGLLHCEESQSFAGSEKLFLQTRGGNSEAYKGECRMESVCKWMTAGILLFVFIGLMSFVSCGFHTAEFFGSIAIALVAARLFYIGICRNYPDHLARQG